jgi:hypothetical protein
MPFAILLVLCAAAQSWLDHTQPNDPGIDFYHFWIVQRSLQQAPPQDIYSRAGRRQVFEQLIGTEVEAPADAEGKPQVRLALKDGVQGREALAGRVLWHVDREPSVLGYAGVETVATPFLFSVFRVFASGDYERDYRSFVAVSLLCALASVYVLCRLAGHGPATALLATGLVLIGFQPLRSDLAMANVNALQLAAVTIFLWLSARSRPLADVLAGAVLGLAVVFKPNLLLVVVGVGVVWLANHWWRKVLAALVGLVGGAVAAVAIGAAGFGALRSWGQWFAILPEVLASNRPVEQGNFALSRLLLDQTGRDYSAPLLLAALVAVAAVAAVRMARTRRAIHSTAQDIAATRTALTEQTFLGVGLGAAVMLISARLAWMHYFVLILPLAIHLLRPSLLTGGRLPWAGRLVAVVLASAALLSLCTVMLLIAPTPAARAVWCNAAVLVMLLLGLRELWPSRRAAAGA